MMLISYLVVEFKDVLSGCCFKKKFNQINDEPEIDMKDNQ